MCGSMLMLELPNTQSNGTFHHTRFYCLTCPYICEIHRGVCYVMYSSLLLFSISITNLLPSIHLFLLYRLRLREDKCWSGKGLTLLSPMMKSTRINQKPTVLLFFSFSHIFVNHPSLAHWIIKYQSMLVYCYLWNNYINCLKMEMIPSVLTDSTLKINVWDYTSYLID